MKRQRKAIAVYQSIIWQEQKKAIRDDTFCYPQDFAPHQQKCAYSCAWSEYCKPSSFGPVSFVCPRGWTFCVCMWGCKTFPFQSQVCLTVIKWCPLGWSIQYAPNTQDFRSKIWYACFTEAWWGGMHLATTNTFLWMAACALDPLLQHASLLCNTMWHDCKRKIPASEEGNILLEPSSWSTKTKLWRHLVASAVTVIL